MRSVLSNSQFTPFGLWIRQYLKDSRELSVTNLDYVIEDFKRKRIMLLEEKQNNGHIHHAQKLTFRVIDQCLKAIASRHGYDYWGFYELRFPRNADMPGPGMKLNGQIITVEQLQKHLNLDQQFCKPLLLEAKEG